jgi:hypothetical protein
MGLFYRKSVNFGPFRVNLSGSGIGYSVGGLGFRVGKSSRGRTYSAFSIPGTGVGYRSSSKGSNKGSSKGCGKGCGCLILITAIPASLALSHWILTSPH